MLAAQLFHERPSLLKLAQRGCMEPHIASTGVHLLAQDADGLALSMPHLANLIVEQAQDDDTKLVEIDDDVVH